MDSAKVGPSIRQEWSPLSWRNYPVSQEIEYPEPQVLDHACRKISHLPPLVPTHEIDALCQRMALVANGEAFVIQGGDCAESFADVQVDIVNAKRSLLSEQAATLEEALGVPIVQIGRIAGQYSKPRTLCKETLSCGSIVNAFRGDNINARGKANRTPDPERLVIGYHLAAATLSMLRASSGTRLESQEKLPTEEIREPRRSTLFTSHEALHLALESSLTQNGYNTSAHMVWIGERTRDINGAHVEYLRGLRNPIGVKLGPTAGDDPSTVLQLLSVLDPDHIPGRVSLITRLGAPTVPFALAPLIRAVHTAGHRPVWLCDPCHGNTFAMTMTATMSLRTRFTETMLAEVKATDAVHRSCGGVPRLGGLHLEQTGEDDVTECADYAAGLVDSGGGAAAALGGGDSLQLTTYRTLCDPRLSRGQASRLVQEYARFVKSQEGQQQEYRAAAASLDRGYSNTEAVATVAAETLKADRGDIKVINMTDDLNTIHQVTVLPSTMVAVQ
ncbi:MAG: hypothetical protein Q9160_008823 [Pyrenula sp. 1 TL-2023]